MKSQYQRILHVDGDSFFASCEIALDPKLKGRPVYVGGGRRGDGIVIAANYIARKFGIITGMACFEAKRKCPEGVLVRPHYDEYRRLSIEMFRRVRHYTPLLVPTSIDEGYLDFTDSPAVFRCRNAAELVGRMKREIGEEIGLPVSMGLGSSRWLAKLATEHYKPDGFHEVPEDKECEFLRDVPTQKLAGIAERRARSLRALGVWTLGDVAQLPLGLLEKRYGFFGLELWLLANGQLRERLSLANKPRTCIGSATTLPYDEPDYESALLFLLDQTERVVTTFFRENLKAREMGVYVRFKDMSGHGESVRFPAPQFEPRVINPQVERLFRQLVACETQPIRQVCIHFWNMQPLDLQPKLFGGDGEFRRRELHHALKEIEAHYGRRSVKTGTRLLLEKQGAHLVSEKAKCPFIPQREMEIKMDKVPEPMLDLIYEDEWKPLDPDTAVSGRAPLPLPRTWGRSTTRELKFS
jgi:DNA polymerase IV